MQQKVKSKSHVVIHSYVQSHWLFPLDDVEWVWFGYTRAFCKAFGQQSLQASPRGNHGWRFTARMQVKHHFREVFEDFSGSCGQILVLAWFKMACRDEIYLFRREILQRSRNNWVFGAKPLYVRLAQKIEHISGCYPRIFAENLASWSHIWYLGVVQSSCLGNFCGKNCSWLCVLTFPWTFWKC